MKNAFITFFLIFCSIILRAQNISVTSFSPLPNDLTANTAGTEVKDQNGEKAALIRIQTTQTGFSFDAGMMGVVKTEQKIGEIWLYVPKGSKHITLRHQQLGTREYTYPCAIETARTYKMILATGNVKTTVEELVTNQFVVFQVEPKDAIVMLDNELLEVTNGLAQKYVPFGSYDYSVEAGDYHQEVGKVTVDDPDNKKIVKVNLKPAFGWIDIQAEGDMVGAKVYMDNKLIGTAPMRTNNISSGQHRIKILKAMYKPWEEMVTVNDNNTTIISPSLSADFCEVAFSVENNAEIWINGERKGVGSWSGRLASGDYKLVTKLIHHRDASLTKSFSAEDGQQTVVLPVPTPILGNIMVTTTPALADITIDGKPYGQTPNAIRNILEGEHTVEIRKYGYLAYSTTINVKEGQTVEVGGKLRNSDVEDYSLPSRSAIAKDTESFKNTIDMKSVDSKINSANQYAASKNYKKAAEMYLSAAHEMSNGVVDNSLQRLSKDKNTPEYLYKKAAETLNKASHKDDYVLANLGVLYYYGRGVKQDYQQATSYLTKPKTLVDADACYCLGMLYYEGKGPLRKNAKKAMKYLAVAAEQNIPEAQNALGKLYYFSGETEQDNQKAFFLFQKAANNGIAESMVYLGDMYRDGTSCSQNYTVAAELYVKAVKLDNVIAFDRLAAFYYLGKGVEKDYAKAAELFKKAADRDLTHAQYALGVLYSRGHGVEKDNKKAEEWLKKVAEKGYAVNLDLSSELDD